MSNLKSNSNSHSIPHSEHFSPQSLKLARERIAAQIHHTPLLESRYLNQLSRAQLYFKCEHLQRVGAFKFRGACHALSQLSSAEKARGVVTHSSGNHAQALALAARELGVQAWIVMPNNAPRVKRRAVVGYGARVIDCQPTLEARETESQRIQNETGAVFIHPYDDPRIIAGQSTVVQEMLESQPDLDVIIAPVGGGGLMSGSALAAHYWGKSGLKVYGAEPTGADDAARSLRAGRLIPSEKPNTIADGLLTSLGDWTFPILQSHLSDILTVTDDEIKGSLRLLWERMKQLTEPSAAVPLAAVLKNSELFKGQKVGLILSGGNVDIAHIAPWFKSV